MKKDLEVEKLFVRVVDQFPFFANILTNFRITADANFPVAAGVYVKNQLAHLRYNPELLLSFSSGIQIGVLEHEVLHVILMHQNRENNRNHLIFNIAADLSINKNLVPEDMLPPTGCFYDKSPFNFPPQLTAEAYYRLIMEDEEKKEEIEKQFGQGTITLIDSHESWKELGDECGLSPDLVREMVKTAVGKLAGSVPGELQHLVDELLKPAKVNWQSVVNSFVNKHVRGQKQHSWSRLSRRLPGQIQGRKKTLVPRLFVGVDSSGSVSDEQLNIFMNEIRHIWKTKCPVTIGIFDCVVHDTYDYEGKEFHTIKSRGGTDFHPVFETIRKTRDVSAVIILTDGQGPFPDDTRYPQTLWVIVKNGIDENDIPFGRAIKIDC